MCTTSLRTIFTGEGRGCHEHSLRDRYDVSNGNDRHGLLRPKYIAVGNKLDDDITEACRVDRTVGNNTTP